MKRLAIITTHPIQYNAPLFKLLSERGKINIKVFYTWGKEVLSNKYDPGFAKSIEWDIPLLEGYDYSFVENIAKKKGSHHYRGIDNPGLIKEIEAWKPDAVLVYGWSFKSHLKAMRYFKTKIPVLFRGDSTLLNQQPSVKSIIRKFFFTWVYKHVDTALYVGTHNKAYYKKYGLKEKQLVFAPHAIDNARFQQYEPENEMEILANKKKLNITPQEIVFLYAGKLDENKNIHFLASAFLNAAIKNCHLVITGNGPEEVRLKNDFSHYPNIHFLPFQNQSQMPLLYKIADVFVLPSISETWGLAINEAMASGKAILASDSCGAAIDLVKNGENGYIFKSNNEPNLIAKLQLLAANKNRPIEMGLASLQIIKDWSYYQIAIAIESIFIQH